MNLLQQTATLTHADAKKHLEIPFEMPAGATQLAITLEFSPPHKEGVKGRNMLCLTLFDPDGFRGAGHNKRDNNVSLSAVAATPGYMPGPLQAGGWRLAQARRAEERGRIAVAAPPNFVARWLMPRLRSGRRCRLVSWRSARPHHPLRRQLGCDGSGQRGKRTGAGLCHAE